MNTDAFARVLHHSRARGTHKLILLSIAFEDDGEGACISVAELAARANCAKRNTQKAIRDLEAMEELQVEPRALQASRYLIQVGCPPGCDGSTEHRGPEKRVDSGPKRKPMSQTVIRSVWDRDDWTCRGCGTHRDLTVDHVIPIAHGGTDDLENLQTLCRSCNSVKGTRSDFEFKALLTQGSAA